MKATADVWRGPILLRRTLFTSHVKTSRFKFNYSAWVIAENMYLEAKSETQNLNGKMNIILMPLSVQTHHFIG